MAASERPRQGLAHHNSRGRDSHGRRVIYKYDYQIKTSVGVSLVTITVEYYGESANITNQSQYSVGVIIYLSSFYVEKLW